jgi:PhnB protein
VLARSGNNKSKAAAPQLRAGGSTMKLNTSINLSFDGNCEAAFRFYERTFGGEIRTLLAWGQSPLAGDVPPAYGPKILYVSLPFGNLRLVGGDAPPGQYEPPQGFAIQLSMADSQEAERLFNVLAEEGTVRMPLQETFWATRYGVLVDRFGIPWEINCGDEA